MGVGVIIQARMGSSRLPGKSLMKLGSKPLIDHVIQRCLASVSPNQVYLATTNQQEDKVLVAHVAETYGIKSFKMLRFVMCPTVVATVISRSN